MAEDEIIIKQPARYGVWLYVSIVLVILLAVMHFTDDFAALRGRDIGADKAEEISIEYINTFLLGENITAVISDVTAISDVYQVTIDIDGNKFISYLSRDGKLLFPQSFDTSKGPTVEMNTTA